MKSEFWHNCWKERDLGFHQTEFNSDLVKFWPDFELEKGSTVLVPLCGKSLDLVWLAKQGHRVIGIELSTIAVTEFFEEIGIDPTIRSTKRFDVYEADNLAILCGDFFQSTADDLGAISAVYDRGALVALPPDMRTRYVSHLKATIAPVPTFLLTLDYDSTCCEGPPFSVDRLEVSRLFEECYHVDVLDAHPLTLPRVEATELVIRMTHP